jgi:ribosomal-protein-alanine N-acetyltransferase
MTRGPILVRGGVVVRPLRKSDAQEWLTLREHNRSWLRPWEATIPGGRTPTVSFATYLRTEHRARRNRTGIPMVIEVGGVLVGRVAVTRIEWGAEAGGSLGYWVAESQAGKAIAPIAVALLAEYAFREGLHRLEIAVRPENAASVRVAQKLGFREEGVRRQYLHIDGAWRDHRIFALTETEHRIGEFWGSPN